MEAHSQFSTKNPWFVRSVLATAGSLAVCAVVGFVLLPYAQPDLKIGGIWDAICSAAGVVRQPSAATPVEPKFKISTVVMVPDMLSQASGESIGRGATLAQKCAICHGAIGVSRDYPPTLAGQYPSVVYKELMDFKTGARQDAAMTPIASILSEQDIVDLAAFYAYLPQLPVVHSSNSAPPTVVINGAPLRNIAPCGACHGGLDNKLGSPRLDGQPAAYLLTQLKAFADGARHNDINEQMRNIARQMTQTEMDQAAAYYAPHSSPAP